MEPTGWGEIAYNHATESENKIHSDEVARRYGFRGGLVPGYARVPLCPSLVKTVSFKGM